jgi:hypothetical protein
MALASLPLSLAISEAVSPTMISSLTVTVLNKEMAPERVWCR